MTRATSRISTDVDFERDGFQTGTLRVPHSSAKPVCAGACNVSPALR